MCDLIASATDTIRVWDIDEPGALVSAAASLCRETLDRDGLPAGRSTWRMLRESFDESSLDRASDVRVIVCGWDSWVRNEDLEDDLLDDQAAAIKLGIVTWVVKFLAKRLGLLEGSDPIPDFDAWKTRLCQALDKFVGPFRDSWVPLPPETSDDR